MTEIIDLTSSPEPETNAANTASRVSNSRPPARMPVRPSPHKRQKTHHVEEDDEPEDSGELLGRFQPRPTPPARNSLNGSHGMSHASAQDNPTSTGKPSQPKGSGWALLARNALAALKGLSNSFTTAVTPSKRKELTEEQDRPASTGPRQRSDALLTAPTAPMYGDRVHAPASGPAYQGGGHVNGTNQRTFVVPEDYPHGLPTPRATTGGSQIWPRPNAPPPHGSPLHRPAAPRSVAAPSPSSRPRLHPFPRPATLPSTQTMTPQNIASQNTDHPTPRQKTAAPTRWTEAEDSLIVYLKHGLGWDFGQITPLLTGRTKGAANTRFCNHLKVGYSLGKAIEDVRTSRWAHVLKPEKHEEMLARPVSGAPLPAVSAPVPVLDTRTIPDLDSAQTGQPSAGTVASQRERRNAQRPTNYYSRALYSGFATGSFIEDDEVVAEPAVITMERPHNEVTGMELRGSKKKAEAKVKKYRSYRPYLSHSEILMLQRGLEGNWDAQELDRWKGTTLHTPLSREELKSLNHSLQSKPGSDHMREISGKAEDEIISALKDATEPDILEYASHARSFLPMRTLESVEAFLRDAADNRISGPVIRLEHQNGVRPSLNSILRNRELGTRSRRDFSKSVSADLMTRVIDTIGPSISFTGTSGDVNTVAWAPNGETFAAGSACLVDADSMQYNRPNNLLFGRLLGKTLHEIPDHYTDRTEARPESGVNSSHAMNVTQDARLFQTVSMVAFSPDSSLLFSAGYDETVRVYDVRGPPELLCYPLRHMGKVDLLSVSMQGLLATGCQRAEKNSIKVIRTDLLGREPEDLFDENGDRLRHVTHSFSSRRAAERPGDSIFPSSLRFDPHSGDHLLAGFTSTSKEELTSGETCLWDVRTGAQLTVIPETRYVFDVTWNPNCWKAPLFAVGCVAGTYVNRGVRSVVKMYDVRAPGRYGMSMELDCPALDMNDVLFCPYDENFVIAGCTNGKTYVWDIRQPRPEVHLYSLVHGDPLMELGDGDAGSRERLDTGIRFCSWGHDRRKLYTGSSDGVVKSWDLYRAPEDVFVKDVVQLNSGVMSGAFSPDFTSLLLGEVNGTINVLETGQSDRSIKEMDSFDFIGSSEPPPDTPTDGNNNTDGSSGITIANHLLQTDQLTLRPMGGLPIRQAVQGNEYTGPWDSADDAPALRAAALRFQRTFSGPSTTQPCNIPACRQTNKLVPEEAGDSGRSADRISGALRSLGLPTTSTTMMKVGKSVAPGVIRCAQCGVRPARMRTEGGDEDEDGKSDDDKDENDMDEDDESEDDSDAAKPLLCERCSFACLRCGKEARVLDEGVERVFCPHCCSLWRADVLGYRLLRADDMVNSDDDDDEEDDDAEDEDDDGDDVDEENAELPAWVASLVKEKKKREKERGAKASPLVKGEKKKKGKRVANSVDVVPTWIKRAGKCRVGETPLGRSRRRGHDYMGEECFEEWLHGRWEDRPASPL